MLHCIPPSMLTGSISNRGPCLLLAHRFISLRCEIWSLSGTAGSGKRSAWQIYGFTAWVVTGNLPALDRACGQARHDLALREHRQEQHRQSDDQRGGGERSPAQLIERNHVVDGDRQRAGLATGQHDAEDKIV